MKDGGPAFPIRERTEHIDGAIVCEEWNGMSLRDWYRGKALQGLLANSLLISAVSSATKDPIKGLEGLVCMAKEAADLMMNEREKDDAL